MMTRKTYGEGIDAGHAVILVKEPGLGVGNHPFWNWLLNEGFHLWHFHGNYGCDWVFINLNSMICAPGMPGIKVVSAIREHAITSDEFRTIWGIFMKYEGLPVLKMPEKTEADFEGSAHIEYNGKKKTGPNRLQIRKLYAHEQSLFSTEDKEDEPDMADAAAAAFDPDGDLL